MINFCDAIELKPLKSNKEIYIPPKKGKSLAKPKEDNDNYLKPLKVSDGFSPRNILKMSKGKADGE